MAAGKLRFQRDEAIKVLAQNPRVYLIPHARGIVVVMFDTGTVDLLKLFRLYPESGGLVSRILDQGLARATLWVVREYPIAAILLLILGAFLLACYALAFVGLRRLPFQTSVVIAAIFLYFVIVSAFPGAVARFRVPIMPLVCIAAGAGIAQWKRREPHSLSVSVD